MSHIAEQYAKHLGAKINRPQLTEHFLPGIPDKYLVLYAPDNMPSLTYRLWNLVFYLIKPILKESDIKVVQLGDPKTQVIKGVDASFLGCTAKQNNYLVKNSLAFVGITDAPAHVASYYDIPSVVLSANIHKEAICPLWHKEKTCINLEPDFIKNKPSFSNDDERLNEIKPELVAQSILDQLGINKTVDFKSIHFGKEFNKDTIEVIPNFFGLNEFMQGKPVTIRGDVHYDEENIAKYLLYLDSALHVSQKFPFEKCTSRLKHLVYHLEEDVEDLNAYFKRFKKSKINVIICTSNKDILNEIRLKYFDYIVDYIDTEEISKDISINENSKFISSKVVFSDSDVYKSIFSAKKLDKSDKFYLNNDSIKELFQLYLYE